MMLIDTTMPRPNRRPLAAAGVAAVIAAGAAGWLAGGVGGGVAPSLVPAAAVTTVGPASLVVPGEWEAVAAPRGTLAFSAAPGLPARVLIAFSPRLDRSLVPGALQAAIGAEIGRPHKAELGGLPAWTYGPVDVGRLTAQVTVAPTTRGVLGVACTAPAGTWNVARDCHAGLDAVRLDAGIRPLRPAPDLAFRQALPAVVAGLDAWRVSGRAALRRRASRRGAARRLARAHAAAAARLAPLATPGPSTALVSALQRDAGAYRAFGRATRGRPSRAGARARARVAATEAALRRALRVAAGRAAQ
jgi:hypothetical protein